ncbi:MAG: ABC transporter substrate-binding protein [Betaproteobacteria bacterium]|nr:ABC transporter substrate-binding protein [Betaproteobacteria bacterium]
MNRRVVLKAAVAGALSAGLPLRLWAQNRSNLKFGLAMPLTGSQSAYGKDQVTAAQWAVDEINAKGGVQGHKLEMIVLDTQADAQVGISTVNRLISVEKVPVFITAWSAVVKAVAPIANREKVLELSVGANSPEIASLGDYVFTTFPLADVDVNAVARYAHQSLGKKTAAVLYINNDTGVEAAKVYRDAFESVGGKVVAYEAYDPKATDYSGMLLKVRAANPEMVHIHGLITDLPQVIAQMRQLGLQQRVSTYSAGYNPNIIKQLGPAAEGLIVTSLAPGVGERPQVKEYVERWQKQENRVPNGLPYTQYLHDAPVMVARMYEWVLKNKLPITGENMRKALLGVRRFDLPLTGVVEVDATHRVKKPVNLMTVEKGKFVLLATVN